MDLIKCPQCGEMYSSTYVCCPFCEEDEDAVKGKTHPIKKRPNIRKQSRSARGALIAVLVLVLALLSLYLFGGELFRMGGGKPSQPVEAVQPSQGGEISREGDEQTPEGTEAVGDPGVEGTPDSASEQTPAQEAAPQPPVDVSGASLNRSDFTLSYAGEKFTIRLSGTEAAPTWSIENGNVASITGDGTVTAIANGNTVVHCKIGDRDLTCTVRVRNTGSNAAPASAPTVAEPITPTAPSVPGTTAPAETTKPAETKPAETTPAETKPASSGSTQHVDVSSLSVKTNYGTKLQKDPGSGYPDCTVRIGGDPLSLVITGTDVPVSSWTSDKTSVVEISDSGKLTPVSAGTAHVTATVGDAQITCIVRVR